MASRKSFKADWYIPEKIRTVETMINRLHKKRSDFIQNSKETTAMTEREFSDFIQEIAHIDSFMRKLKNDLVVLRQQQERSKIEYGF